MRPGVIVLLALAWSVTACGPRVLVDDDAGRDPGTSDDGGGTTTSMPPSTTSPPPATATVPTTDPTDEPPPDPTVGGPVGYCAPACETASDCCYGNPDCPGPYPENWSCTNGACVHGGCSSDEQCPVGLDTPWICIQREVYAWCLPSCQTDQDCLDFFLDGWGCTIDQEGRGHCWPNELCEVENYVPCEGGGSCDPDTGACLCYSDADCDPSSVCHFD